MELTGKQNTSRGVLVGLNCSNLNLDIISNDNTLDELENLLETAGGEAVGRILQNRECPDSKYFLGEGKIKELKEFAEANNADLIVFDNELSPSQIKNIEDAVDIRVIDRTMLILDIFSLHATTREGKLQVEAALLKYTIPRLFGKGTELSRLGGGGGGGIGARRGSGETKLEIDKRHLKEQIRSIERELKEIKENRLKQRKARDESGIPKVAIIGYTNAGKSTLLNYLTNAGVLAEDKLFATLDPTTRKMKMDNGFEFLLTDTVGFIRKLPHHLIEAFSSTLDEAKFADLLVNVVDGSDEELYEHIKVTEKILIDLGAGGIPIITAINKADKINPENMPIIKDSVVISAKTGYNIDKLLDLIYEKLSDSHKKVEILIPFDKSYLVDEIYKTSNATVIERDYTSEGTKLKIICDNVLYGRLKQYINNDNGE